MKPNIIFLMTDQQRWDALGIMNPSVITPNLDSLAHKGILFEQTVCQCPMCIPSRNSMMIGFYPSQLGVRSNGGGFFEESRIPAEPLPELLHKAGYQTAGFGKMHWQHHHPELNPNASTRGFEHRAGTWGCDRETGMKSMEEISPESVEIYNKAQESYGPGGENAAGYKGGILSYDICHDRDMFLLNMCMEFLENELDPERPLFLYLSFNYPHAPITAPEEYEACYDIEKIPDMAQPPWEGLPESHVRSVFDNSAFLGGRYREWHEAWEQMAPMERRWTTLRYWANCTWMDALFGEVLKKLDSQHQLDNCLIIFTSDHGEMLGERRHLFSKYCLYEGSVRVPLILSGSCIPQEHCGSRNNDPAELVDIVPTICQAAGIKKNPMLPGRDLLEGSRRIGSFAELHGGGLLDEPNPPAPAYMWRKKDWKLILYLHGIVTEGYEHVDQAYGELYDLANDPQEWNNLYTVEEFAGIREQMKTELLMHLAVSWAKGPFFYHYKGTSILE
jgi:arylsulfatase A-like enzyme